MNTQANSSNSSSSSSWRRGCSKRLSISGDWGDEHLPSSKQRRPQPSILQSPEMEKSPGENDRREKARVEKEDRNPSSLIPMPEGSKVKLTAIRCSPFIQQ